MTGVLSHLAKRRRYATGGVGMSDPRVRIPEQSPNALTEPATPSLAGPAAAGRTYHPLDQADYYTYGQKGPEHQFFTGSLPVAPLRPDNLPSGGGGGGGGSSGGGGAAGVLGNLVDLAGTAKTAGELANMAGYDNSFTDALKNPVKAGKDYLGYLGDNRALSGAGSGVLGNQALTDAGFGSNWTTPALDGSMGDIGEVTPSVSRIDSSGSTAPGATGSGVDLGSAMNTAGDLAGIYTGIQQGDLGGYAKAAGSAASLAGYDVPYLGYIDAATKLMDGDVGGAGYSAMINAAGPVAALGSFVADQFNKSGDIKSGATSALMDQLVSQQGWKSVGGRTPAYVMPNGTYVRPDEHARAVSEAVRKGDQAAAEKAWEEWMATAKPWYGKARGGSLETGGAGALHYATDPKFIGSVRGEGTGRSDEIPASLSDGEYVMDAETVALLGDGSTDAGARKLDEMRERLRAHKGKKLSKGKFSDNAKHPMEYLK